MLAAVDTSVQPLPTFVQATIDAFTFAIQLVVDSIAFAIQALRQAVDKTDSKDTGSEKESGSDDGR